MQTRVQPPSSKMTCPVVNSASVYGLEPRRPAAGSALERFLFKMVQQPIGGQKKQRPQKGKPQEIQLRRVSLFQKPLSSENAPKFVKATSSGYPPPFSQHKNLAIFLEKHTQSTVQNRFCTSSILRFLLLCSFSCWSCCLCSAI